MRSGNTACYFWQPTCVHRRLGLELPTHKVSCLRVAMESRHKILVLDDDPELLELYGEMLGQLPSKPEIHTASTGARAMALLEAEPFRLLICDLKMPKMDGLQVL